MILYSKDETCSFKIERPIFIHQNNVESQYNFFLRGPVWERARIIKASLGGRVWPEMRMGLEGGNIYVKDLSLYPPENGF